jgi:hypothetical protein
MAIKVPAEEEVIFIFAPINKSRSETPVRPKEFSLSKTPPSPSSTTVNSEGDNEIFIVLQLE